MNDRSKSRLLKRKREYAARWAFYSGFLMAGVASIGGAISYYGIGRGAGISALELIGAVILFASMAAVVGGVVGYAIGTSKFGS